MNSDFLLYVCSRIYLLHIPIHVVIQFTIFSCLVFSSYTFCMLSVTMK